MREARTYYEQAQAGLGQDFAREVGCALRDIAEYPRACRIHSKRCRRRNIKRFPYGIVYHIRADETIDVVAVMYLGRHPKYWHDLL